MKTIIKITVTFLLFFTTSSCMFDGFGIQGNRNVVSENRKISSEFEGIKVSQGITVYLTQGDDIELTVEADENIIDILITEVEGDVLNIYFDKNVNRAKARNVYLTTDNINSIKTSSGSHVKAENTLSAKNMDLRSTSGSGINANFDVQRIICSTTSGANINISGSTSYMEASASSGSHIDAKDLKSNISKADVSSGAGINLYAQDELTAHASSGGNIGYYGHPEVVNKSKSSGGNITKR